MAVAMLLSLLLDMDFQDLKLTSICNPDTCMLHIHVRIVQSIIHIGTRRSASLTPVDLHQTVVIVTCVTGVQLAWRRCAWRVHLSVATIRYQISLH